MTKRGRLNIRKHYQDAIEEWVRVNKHLDKKELEKGKRHITGMLRDQLMLDKYVYLGEPLKSIDMVIAEKRLHIEVHKREKMSQ